MYVQYRETLLSSTVVRRVLYTSELKENHVDDTEDKRKENRHTETANLESRSERAHEEDNEAVDDQGKETKRQDVDRQCEKYQERLDEYICES